MNEHRQIENLAAFVHGALAFGHVLGVIWNLKRRNYFQASVHAGVALYDTWATSQHIERKP